MKRLKQLYAWKGISSWVGALARDRLDDSEEKERITQMKDPWRMIQMKILC